VAEDVDWAVILSPLATIPGLASTLHMAARDGEVAGLLAVASTYETTNTFEQPCDSEQARLGRRARAEVLGDRPDVPEAALDAGSLIYAWPTQRQATHVIGTCVGTCVGFARAGDQSYVPSSARLVALHATARRSANSAVGN